MAFEGLQQAIDMIKAWSQEQRLRIAHRHLDRGLSEYLERHGAKERVTHTTTFRNITDMENENSPERWMWETWEFKNVVRDWNLTPEEGEVYLTNHEDGEALGPRVDLNTPEQLNAQSYKYVLFLPK